MHRFIVSLIVAVTLLLCGAQGAALAHTHLGDAGHAVEILDDGHHDATPEVDQDQSAPEPGGDVAQHHHCSAGLTDEVLAVRERVVPIEAQPTPALEAAMSSRSTAPPIEPPAA